MHILNQGENHWKLRIESEDDLWVLARLASNGRHLAMLGERRDTTTAESGSRAKAAERKKMWIELRILSTEYQSYSDILRVHGTCLLYTSPSPRDLSTSRMPSSA